MHVTINAPAVRSLTPNEKAVYKLLREGRTVPEIAAKLKMAVGENYSSFCQNPLNFSGNIIPDTVKGCISAIREKGWDIEIKEECEMPQKTNPDKINEIRRLRGEGKSHAEIAEIMKMPASTVGRYCKIFDAEAQARQDIAAEEADKKEPAAEAPAASSETYRAQEDIPADISITEPQEKVKPDILTDVAEAVCFQIETLNADIESAKYKMHELTEYMESAREKKKNLETFLRENDLGDVLALGRGTGP